MNKGVAEVVYVKLEDAHKAISKYNQNELDGQQMRIELINEDGSRANAYQNHNSVSNFVSSERPTFLNSNKYSNQVISSSDSYLNNNLKTQER